MTSSAHILVVAALAFIGPAAAVPHHCDGSDTPAEKRADVDKEGPSPIVIYVLEAKGSG
ncbi:MAG: hypothetical protein QF404_01495 [Planctomycetota bacterium]|jgi:hypothetical protein|nr:hypothetical protein [Planctomycetota bacterium]MDP6939150.1 hypothetical protein [Planctomycetota bacterium]